MNSTVSLRNGRETAPGILYANGLLMAAPSASGALPTLLHIDQWRQQGWQVGTAPRGGDSIWRAHAAQPVTLTYGSGRSAGAWPAILHGVSTGIPGSAVTWISFIDPNTSRVVRRTLLELAGDWKLVPNPSGRW